MNRYSVNVLLSSGKSVTVTVFAPDRLTAEYKAKTKAFVIFKSGTDIVQNVSRLGGESPL